jgi:hypothetical protein
MPGLVALEVLNDALNVLTAEEVGLMVKLLQFLELKQDRVHLLQDSFLAVFELGKKLFVLLVKVVQGLFNFLFVAVLGLVNQALKGFAQAMELEVLGDGVH